MSRKQLTFWESERLTFDDSLKLFIDSILAYAVMYEHWVVAWSGGKDSTTLVTLLVSMIESKQIPKPKTLTVLISDTRMEFTPLWISAMELKSQLEARGIEVRVIRPELDKRFFVYMLGRGVPPPSNTFRWCTPNIKIAPMQSEIEKIYNEFGKQVLLMTGVRLGESAVRDRRIALSCSKDGAECGQGWFQHSINDKQADKLSPILHFRVCTVWDWLRIFAPSKKYGNWNTELLALAYGGEEAEEINARTGCNGCPLVNKDTAIDKVLSLFPQWAYLSPLKKLRPLYRALRLYNFRLRKTEPQFKVDGKLAKNQNRIGPLTMEARAWGLDNLIKIQTEINNQAISKRMPMVDLINQEEVLRIREMWDNNVWPEGWDGHEQRADLPFIHRYANGTVQLNI
jgi:DNA sulfur modification protein DndC